jgi:hypothetical protein
LDSPIHLRIQTLEIDRDDRIVYVYVQPKATLELADAQASIAASKRLFGAERGGCLVDMRGLVNMSREARQYYSGPEPLTVHVALALVVGSPLNRAIGNFFMGLSPPPMPTRLFDTIEDAQGWLRTVMASAA